MVPEGFFPSGVFPPFFLLRCFPFPPFGLWGDVTAATSATNTILFIYFLFIYFCTVLNTFSSQASSEELDARHFGPLFYPLSYPCVTRLRDCGCIRFPWQSEDLNLGLPDLGLTFSYYTTVSEITTGQRDLKAGYKNRNLVILCNQFFSSSA